MFIIKLRSIFLIVGTAIGAGVLALPIATVEAGFWGAFWALIFTWVFMTLSANNLLKARLIFKDHADLATMSEYLLGRIPKILIDISYLALLFGLVSLYITIGSAWLRELMSYYFSQDLNILESQFIFTIMIASLIYTGIASVLIVNKIVTLAMLIFISLIIVMSVPAVQTIHLTGLSHTNIPHTLPMLITTFGFAIVMPSLATYMENNKAGLTQSLFIGSVIILITYIAWELVAFGAIGAGTEGLAGLASSKDQGTEVINALSLAVNQPLFTRIGFALLVTAVLSSVFGVGYCLYAYLQDTLPIKKQPLNSLLAVGFGFLTPLMFLSLFPMGVSAILGVSGIFVAIILGIVPNAMILSPSYQTIEAVSKFEKTIAYLTIAFFILVILIEIDTLLS